MPLAVPPCTSLLSSALRCSAGFVPGWTAAWWWLVLLASLLAVFSLVGCPSWLLFCRVDASASSGPLSADCSGVGSGLVVSALWGFPWGLALGAGPPSGLAWVSCVTHCGPGSLRWVFFCGGLVAVLAVCSWSFLVRLSSSVNGGKVPGVGYLPFGWRHWAGLLVLGFSWSSPARFGVRLCDLVGGIAGCVLLTVFFLVVLPFASVGCYFRCGVPDVGGGSEGRVVCFGILHFVRNGTRTGGTRR